jgi:hypothetical protein
MQATTDAWNCNYPSHRVVLSSDIHFLYILRMKFMSSLYVMICGHAYIGHYYLLAHCRHVHSDWGCDSECITTG